MKSERGAETSRDFGGKMGEVGNEVGENSSVVKLGYRIDMVPVNTGQDTFCCHFAAVVLDNTLDMIVRMECAGFAVVKAEGSACNSHLEHALASNPLLVHAVIALDIIRQLSPFHLAPRRGIANLRSQALKARVCQGIQRAASRAVADTIAETAHHPLDVNVGLARKKPEADGET